MINGLYDFIRDHRLPAAYGPAAELWFVPLAERLAEKRKRLGKTLIAGINGAQGSGKSTLADLLALLCRDIHHLNAIVLSLDDFYLTRQQRQLRATTIHPLLATRGVPGTHDVSLAIDVIQKLARRETPTLVPRFDKASDDRYPQDQWTRAVAKVDLILLEGWCLGAEPQAERALAEPVNDLEKKQDPNGAWRRYVNQQLQHVYPQLFNMIDTWIMLKAPSFDCVYQWRLEQENRLKSTLPHPDRNANGQDRTMDATAIKHFIQHYQRITEHLLETLPAKADVLFILAEDRRITAMH